MYYHNNLTYRLTKHGRLRFLERVGIMRDSDIAKVIATGKVFGFFAGFNYHNLPDRNQWDSMRLITVYVTDVGKCLDALMNTMDRDSEHIFQYSDFIRRFLAMITKEQFYDAVVKKYPEIEWPDKGWLDDCVQPFWDDDDKCGCWIMKTHNIVVKDVGCDNVITEDTLKEAKTWCIGIVAISNLPAPGTEEADNPIGTLDLEDPSLEDIAWWYDEFLQGYKTEQEARNTHEQCLNELAMG